MDGLRPRALDLFCGGGGASAGLVLAGYDVTGVDIAPQPHYPFRFGRADALLLPRDWLETFDLIWASPPCQRYTSGARQARSRSTHPDLLAPTRRLLEQAGRPFVIENVPKAPLRRDLLLCGVMFGLRVVRHRWFEVSGFEVTQPRHEPHPLTFTHDKRKAHYGQRDQAVSLVQVTGGGNATIANKRAAMGCQWMSNDELNEAVPPAYSRYIASFALATVPA